MNKTHLLIISLFGFSLFAGCGSSPSDISSQSLSENPLPSCPDSPNCIRITKQIEAPSDEVFDNALATLNAMGPQQITEQRDSLKIATVFNVAFVFQDDMAVQVTVNDSTSSMLHVRSASRVGESDLGVNTRRVKTFLQEFRSRL
ncbi:MAG: DUF1499 domain-containing protein [Fodinibius sp.]|nr:DUF1499 domain-containing protein [Fodinibius sp.]